MTSEYAEFSNFNAERGRMMSPIEVERSRPVAIIGWDVADRLFGDVNPLDKEIRIAGIQFRVVGVSKRRGSVFGNSQDDFAVIPLGAYMRLFGARQSLTLLVKPTSPEVLQAAMDDATVALRVARRLKPREPDNFGMFTSDTVLGLYTQATNGIFAVLVGVVALSLVVGGIVIMNIMLMVVSERTREIGLRKALGAKRRDIMSQVLTESIVAVDVRRHRRHPARLRLRHGHRRGDAAAGDARALVGRARRRHHRRRRPVLRRLPGVAGGGTRSDRGTARETP